MTELASAVVLYLRRSRLTLTLAALEGRTPGVWRKWDRRWKVDRAVVKEAALTNRSSPPILFALLLCIVPALGFAENLYWDAHGGWVDNGFDVFWSTVLAVVIVFFLWVLRRPTLRLLTTQGEWFIPMSRLERTLSKRLVDELQRGVTATAVRAAAPSFIRA